MPHLLPPEERKNPLFVLFMGESESSALAWHSFLLMAGLTLSLSPLSLSPLSLSPLSLSPLSLSPLSLHDFLSHLLSPIPSLFLCEFSFFTNISRSLSISISISLFLSEFSFFTIISRSLYLYISLSLFLSPTSLVYLMSFCLSFSLVLFVFSCNMQFPLSFSLCSWHSPTPETQNPLPNTISHKAPFRNGPKNTHQTEHAS